MVPTSLSHLDDGSEGRWEGGIVREAQKILFWAVGEQASEWQTVGGKSSDLEKSKLGRKGDLGEGGMYI